MDNMKNQKVSDRLKRLKYGCCPIHGRQLYQTGLTDNGAFIVSCSCGVQGISKIPFGPITLMKEYRHLIKKTVANTKLEIEYKPQFKKYINKGITCEGCMYCSYKFVKIVDEDYGEDFSWDYESLERTAWCNLWWFQPNFVSICKTYCEDVGDMCVDKHNGDREQL